MHVYALAGDYIVTLKVFNGCGEFSISQPINVDLTTGIATLGKDQADVLVYPNPARNLLRIDNKSTSLKMEEITIYNMLGAVLYRQKIDGLKEYQVPVGHLASGAYFLRILTSEGWVNRKFEIVK